MKWNTLITYSQSARYRPWEPEDRNGVLFRNYLEGERIKCGISLTAVGTLQLTTDQQLQTFAAIQSIEDAAGNRVLDDTWYTVQKVTPIFDAGGYITSYRHTLAVLAPELIALPIDPPAEYPDLDQGP